MPRMEAPVQGTFTAKCAERKCVILLLLFLFSCSVVSDSFVTHGHGILQARTLEWVAFPFSRGSSQLRDQTQVSCITGVFFTAEPPGKPRCVITKPISATFKESQ